MIAGHLLTVVHGIGSMSDLKKVGVGVKTLFTSRRCRRWRWRSACWSAGRCSPARIWISIRPRSMPARLRPASSGQRGGLRRPPAGIIPTRSWARSLGANAAGPAGVDPHRLCHRAHGRAGREDQRRIEAMAKVFGVIKIIVRAAPIGVRRHGLYRRRLQWAAVEPDRAGPDVLSHQHPVRAGRSAPSRGSPGSPSCVSSPTSRTVADRARHLVVGDEAPHIQKMEHLGARSVVGLRS